MTVGTGAAWARPIETLPNTRDARVEEPARRTKIMSAFCSSAMFRIYWTTEP
jgi:hypothetical protein